MFQSMRKYRLLWFMSLAWTVHTQCDTQQQNFHAPVNGPYGESEEIVPQLLLRDMIKFVTLIRAEWWFPGPNNLTITRANDPSCAFLSSGMGMEELEGLESSWSLPLMTDLTIIGNSVYIPGNLSATVTFTQFSELAELLGFTSRINVGKHHKVVVRLDAKSFHNFDASETNSCRMEGITRTLRHQMNGMLISLSMMWNKFIPIMRAYGQDNDLNSLRQCSGSKNLTLQALVYLADPMYSLCVRPMLSKNTTRVKRGVSLLSELFGDGTELIRLEGTLSEAINRYNMNFQKEEIFDNQVTKSLKDLDSELGHILDNEEKLKHRILRVQIELRQNSNTYNF